MLDVYPSMGPVWRRTIFGVAIGFGLLVTITVGEKFGSNPESGYTKSQGDKAGPNGQFGEVKNFESSNLR